jgi:low affinity Fe/Cu permease
MAPLFAMSFANSDGWALYVIAVVTIILVLMVVGRFWPGR